MKLVVNKCYGGFSLSPKAISRLAELRGQKAYFFVGGIGDDPRVQVPLEEINGIFWSAYNTPTPMANTSPEEWHAMSQKERQAHNAKSNAESLDTRPNNRADPLLVQTVEELGGEADGSCAKLRIVEIPDGVDWEINEYDGMESVHEKHRSW